MTVKNMFATTTLSNTKIEDCIVGASKLAKLCRKNKGDQAGRHRNENVIDILHPLSIPDIHSSIGYGMESHYPSCLLSSEFHKIS